MIDPLPTPPPSRQMAPDAYIAAMDAFLASLSTFVTQANALEEDLNNQVTAAFTTTSNTSLAVSAGTKTLTVQTGLAYAPGQTANLARTSAPSTTRMVGTVQTYDKVTGLLQVVVPSAGVTGSGTFTDWSISLGPAIVAAPYDGFRNRLINGDMRFDQRNAGAVLNNILGTNYPADRWGLLGTQAAKLSGQRVAFGGFGSAGPTSDGFTHVLQCTSLSAYAPVAADVFQVHQSIEGQHVADLMWGSSVAKSGVLSFWAFSSVAGTHAGSVINSAGNRSYVFTYTLAASTWTYVTVTIPGDTTGTWLVDNGVGIRVRFNLGAGSNAQAAAANAWNASARSTVAGAVNICATNGATFYITGVQFEVGSLASAFERRPHAVELQLCQRYYEKSYDVETATGAVAGAGQAILLKDSAATAFWLNVTYKVEKRTGVGITAWNPGILNTTIPVNYQSTAGQYSAVAAMTAASFPGSSAAIQWSADAEL